MRAESRVIKRFNKIVQTDIKTDSKYQFTITYTESAQNNTRIKRPNCTDGIKIGHATVHHIINRQKAKQGIITA